jgi:multidrug efflux pump subunit AcrA (membrane-fusion protein)
MKMKKDAIVIPLAAVIKENNSDGVYLINSDKAFFKPVTIGTTDGQFVEVIAGLKTGDKIVTLGMNNLNDGTVVIVSNK